ncbi:hypothetical protein [Demequina globuliformis]|uniref:hypothetical protein n=1 Tax=Demequina globuliformis TaxID=676202 RepID=UPI000784C824|nr:hypothetical protein [Demequina globuliformis]
MIRAAHVVTAAFGAVVIAVGSASAATLTSSARPTITSFDVFIEECAPAGSGSDVTIGWDVVNPCDTKQAQQMAPVAPPSAPSQAEPSDDRETPNETAPSPSPSAVPEQDEQPISSTETEDTTAVDDPIADEVVECVEPAAPPALSETHVDEPVAPKPEDDLAP